MLITELRKEIKTNLAFVIWVSVLLDAFDKFSPFASELFKNLCVNLNGLIGVHLLVEHAEVLIILGRLPTFVVKADVDLALLRLLLPEIETFGRKHL